MPTDGVSFIITLPGDTPVSTTNPLPVALYPGVGGAAVTLKFVRVNATSDGDNTVIAAVVGKKIRVIGYAIVASAAGTVTIQDSQGTPVIHASFPLAANGGVSYAGSIDAPAFETAEGFGVEISNGAGVDTLGHMTYIEV